jgi:hypothetical protein
LIPPVIAANVGIAGAELLELTELIELLEVVEVVTDVVEPETLELELTAGARLEELIIGLIAEVELTANCGVPILDDAANDTAEIVEVVDPAVIELATCALSILCLVIRLVENLDQLDLGFWTWRIFGLYLGLRALV